MRDLAFWRKPPVEVDLGRVRFQGKYLGGEFTIALFGDPTWHYVDDHASFAAAMQHVAARKEPVTEVPANQNILVAVGYWFGGPNGA